MVEEREGVGWQEVEVGLSKKIGSEWAKLYWA
jgi:hypothetical protein